MTEPRRRPLPSPIHGWRAFWGEVGIIVLGVLIALVAQQLATDIDERSRADTAMRAVAAELAINAGSYDERVVQQPCLERRLDQITTIIGKAKRDRVLPAIVGLGRSIGRPTLRSAWDDARGNEVFAHWSTRDRATLSSLYSQQAPSDALTLQETGLWIRLNTMLSMMAGPVSDSDLTALAALVGEIRFLTWNNGIDAKQMLGVIKGRKIVPVYDLIFDHPGAAREAMLARVAGTEVCNPLKIVGGGG